MHFTKFQEHEDSVYPHETGLITSLIIRVFVIVSKPEFSSCVMAFSIAQKVDYS